jgi:hypothetical protein
VGTCVQYREGGKILIEIGYSMWRQFQNNQKTYFIVTRQPL